ncbi:uncharacterized protein LOC129779874 [Toxorhynchites rutilus septentrionalis]|uniref:uncharacterized protein LOC129779874 n=1 Tax=Toxorhynchites rutilus septentrionalis TaxID=329112 RepID=UPI00247919C6|nr:uncharacterized protein LOC129779874 [Toxorhynchites rutilus septentrionalis]
MVKTSDGKPTMDKTVFKYFDKLINVDKEIRLRGAFDLISFFNESAHSDGGKIKERAYALKRLVRGIGSNNNASRAGFFTALVGYLEEFQNTELSPTIAEIFNLVKTELCDIDDGDSKKQQSKLEQRVGQISVCGAIITSGLIEGASDDELQTVMKALKKGMYKSAKPLAFSYLSELVKKVDKKKFNRILWPLFEEMLIIPKEEQTMDTVHFLLVASAFHGKSINGQFYENNFASPQMLHVKNYGYLAGLLWDIPNTDTINHPYYDFLIEQLVKQNKMVEFWTHGVDPILSDSNSAHKYKDIVALRVFITILNKTENFDDILNILSSAMLEMVLNRVKSFSQLSEDVRDLYQEAFEALNDIYTKITEESKLKLFEKLIDSPSSILIEKHANVKIIQNLLNTMDGDSVKKVAIVLKKFIIADDRTDVLNSERTHAAHLLQKLLTNRHVLSEYEWRIDIVKFFLDLGIFFSDGRRILKLSKDHSSALSPDLVPTMKSLFFHCLEHSYPKLTEKKAFLLSFVDHVQSILQKSGNKVLRMELSDDHLQSWNRMYKIITSTEKRNKKLTNVFNILMMYMGLHLFSDPELASSSIGELESVMKRVQQKKSTSKKNNMEIDQSGSSGEPEWIEVVIDLFLNLLSQNSHLLRKVIGHVFPHLSSEMTITAFNQILSVINLKDKTNPLSADEQKNEEESNGDDMESEEDDDDTNGEDSDETGASANEEDTEQEESEQEDGFTDDEKDDTVTEKMRMAIHAALGAAKPETDTESVDLDDMNEEDGKRLDEALAEAFKMFKQSKKTKPTKAEERVETTLTHFRMRVFDLIDIYLKHTPNLVICLELMLYVFEMLPIAIKETKHKQILDRYRQIFNNLTKVKQSNIEVKDVSADQLSQILIDLMEKVAKGSSFPEKNQYLLKACQFIVISSQLVEKNNNNGKNARVDKMFSQYIKDFLSDRNPPLTLNVFQTLFRMVWTGNWRIAESLAEHGLKKQTRVIRRTQTLQLLKELMKNRRLINANSQSALKSIKAVVNSLNTYMEEISQSHEISQNEFNELVEFLLELQCLQKQIPNLQCVKWNQISAQIQSLRRINLNSHAMSNYSRLCKQLQIEPVKNNQIKLQNGTSKRKSETNGAMNGDESDDSDDEVENVQSEDQTNGNAKRKKKANSSKQKRLRKEERLKAASVGLETVSFLQ